MLPKSFRLSRPEILKLRAGGRRFQGPCFSLISLPNTTGHLRLTVEISLKVDKRATQRNYLRRQVFLVAEKEPVLKKPVDVLVIVKSSINNIASDPTKLKKEISAALSAI